MCSNIKWFFQKTCENPMLAIVDFLCSLMPISTSAHASDDLICTYMRHLILHDAYNQILLKQNIQIKQSIFLFTIYTSFEIFNFVTWTLLTRLVTWSLQFNIRQCYASFSWWWWNKFRRMHFWSILWFENC